MTQHTISTRPSTSREELNEWTAQNPRDKMALAMFAAWVNCPVGNLPKEMKGHTCQATMEAWGRVADAAKKYLEETEAKP